jgi:hypothetical protein
MDDDGSESFSKRLRDAHRKIRRNGRLPWAARVIGGEMLSYYGKNNRKGPVFRTAKQLCVDFGFKIKSESAIRRGLKDLEDEGVFVFKRRPGQSTLAWCRYMDAVTPHTVCGVSEETTDTPHTTCGAYNDEDDDNSFSHRRRIIAPGFDAWGSGNRIRAEPRRHELERRRSLPSRFHRSFSNRDRSSAAPTQLACEVAPMGAGISRQVRSKTTTIKSSRR